MHHVESPDTPRNILNFNVTTNAVPEPSTLLLLGAGLAGVGLIRKRTKN
jgi:hypothetical protein